MRAAKQGWIIRCQTARELIGFDCREPACLRYDLATYPFDLTNWPSSNLLPYLDCLLPKIFSLCLLKFIAACLLSNL